MESTCAPKPRAWVVLEMVLETPELFEEILRRVDMKTVLLSQRVSKDWQAKITDTESLQKKLFFKAAKDEELVDCGIADTDQEAKTMMVASDTFDAALESIPLEKFHQANPLFPTLRTRQWHFRNDSTSISYGPGKGPVIYQNPVDPNPENWNNMCPREPAEIYSWMLMQVDRPKGIRPSWLKMLLTQPPHLPEPRERVQDSMIDSGNRPGFDVFEAWYGVTLLNRYFWDSFRDSVCLTETCKICQKKVRPGHVCLGKPEFGWFVPGDDPGSEICHIRLSIE